MFIPIGAIFLLLVAASITFAVIHINGIDKAYL